MTLFDFDAEEDVLTACHAVAFLPNLGATLSNLEAINGVSYQPGTRFGTALAAAVQRGLVRFDGARYHLIKRED